MNSDPVAAIVAAWKRERPDLDASPLLILGRIDRLDADLDALLRPPFAGVGLASGDFDLLAALRRAGEPYELTPTALANAMLVTQGAATKRVDRLARQGYVERVASRLDGRSVPVRLTADGRVLVDRLIEIHLANEARLLSGLTAAERAQLSHLLGRLQATLPPA